MPYLNRPLIRTALGDEPADMIIKGGKLINVYTSQIQDADVAIKDGRIAAIGDVDYTQGDETQVLDADGMYLSPGLIEPHIHPEVSKITLTSIANAIVPRGTTSIMCSLDQIGVVAGLEGMRWALDEANKTHLKVFFAGPSRLPYTTPASTVAYRYGLEEHRIAQQWEESVGIWEYMSDSVVDFDETVYPVADLTVANRQTLHGHSPAARGRVLSAHVAAGMRTDHESYTLDELTEKLSNGVYCLIRRGTRHDKIPSQIKCIVDMGYPSHFLSLCTDDLDCLDIEELGLIDYLVRYIIQHGVDPVTAIQMGSLNAACAYRVDHLVGAVAPGRLADVLLLSDLQNLTIEAVVAKGNLVMQGGEVLEDTPSPEYPDTFYNTVRLDKPVTTDDIYIMVDQNATRAEVQCINFTLAGGPLHQRRDAVAPVENGLILPDPDNDVSYITVTERYTGSGKTSSGFLSGYGFKRGAIATSSSPDDNNIICIGASVDDMTIAINHLVELGGGQVVVDNDEVTAEIPLPLCGVMADIPVSEMAELERKLNEAAYRLGTSLERPFFHLMFFSITAIPDYAITDMGVVERASRSVINPVLGIEKT